MGVKMQTWVRLSEIEPFKWNHKKAKRNYSKMQSGQTLDKPLVKEVSNKTYQVKKGHTIVAAAIMCGKDKIWAEIQPK